MQKQKWASEKYDLGRCPPRKAIVERKGENKSERSNVFSILFFCNHKVWQEPAEERYTLGFKLSLIPERYDVVNMAGSAALSGPDLFPVDSCSSEKNINLPIERNKISQVRGTISLGRWGIGGLTHRWGHWTLKGDLGVWVLVLKYKKPTGFGVNN